MEEDYVLCVVHEGKNKIKKKKKESSITSDGIGENCIRSLLKLSGCFWRFKGYHLLLSPVW